MTLNPIERHLRRIMAEAVLAGRQAVGWSQAELSRRSGVSVGMIATIETGRANPTVRLVGQVLAPLGVALDLRYTVPYSERRQRDAVHARCVAYVRRRLEQAGWLVLREVEVGSARGRGWIDVLAWRPADRQLLVIEVKTELHDVGQVERTLGWYEREAQLASRRAGWSPARVAVWLLLLATQTNDERVRENREALAQSLPCRVPDLERFDGHVRGLAMIDPGSRRRSWLQRSRVDGRRSVAPYANYRDFVNRAHHR